VDLFEGLGLHLSATHTARGSYDSPDVSYDLEVILLCLTTQLRSQIFCIRT